MSDIEFTSIQDFFKCLCKRYKKIYEEYNELYATSGEILVNVNINKEANKKGNKKGNKEAKT